MEVSKLFTRSNYLYNIVSIDNLNSILDYDILSKNMLDQHFNYTDISNTLVQNIRDNIYITKNRMLQILQIYILIPEMQCYILDYQK